MGVLLNLTTGVSLLAAVAYLGAAWGMTDDGAPADLAGAKAPIACTDEHGQPTPPEGLVVGGPDDNTDEEPYKSWYAKCRDVLARGVQEPAPSGAKPPSAVARI